jgi:hypothetical protein
VSTDTTTGGEQAETAEMIEIARLRRELAEMVGCATHWCAEAGRSEREHRETLVRCRTAAQILIASIGASGPENVEETARRAVEVLQRERQLRVDLLRDLDAARALIGEGRS